MQQTFSIGLLRTLLLNPEHHDEGNKLYHKLSRVKLESINLEDYSRRVSEGASYLSLTAHFKCRIPRQAFIVGGPTILRRLFHFVRISVMLLHRIALGCQSHTGIVQACEHTLRTSAMFLCEAN